MGITSSPTPPRRIAGRVYEWEFPRAERGGTLIEPGVVRCVGPTGQAVNLSAFADGDRWRARLAAYPPGEWRWTATNGSGSGTLTVPLRADADRWPRSPLRLSENRRYLTDATGTAFFFFADTAWSIVWKGTLDQWERYLDRRAAQGFSVIQVNLLPWRWEFTDVEGNRPFHDSDPTWPNEAYFRRFDQFCAMAAQRGLYVCLMLIWGGPRPTLPAVNFSTEQAIAFTRYAVTRFSAYPMLWSVSGDGPYAEEIEKWEAVGEAVEAADPYGHPTTNHLPPTMNWHALHHNSSWHDFHMIQTGHRRGATADIVDLALAYYKREPVKAYVNGEPWYEAHPSRDTREYGPVFTPFEARYAFWASVLSGATMGHTYGSQGIWNWKRPGDDEQELAGPQIGPVWSEALDHPGARQCGIGASLLRTLPWWQLQPCPERMQLDPPPDGAFPPACARVPGKVWLAYLPDGSRHAILKGIEPASWHARWFDPRTGEEHAIGSVTVGADLKWQAPLPPTSEDWVLILTK